MAKLRTPEEAGFRVACVLPLPARAGVVLWRYVGEHTEDLIAQLCVPQNVVGLLSDTDVTPDGIQVRDLWMLRPVVPRWPEETYLLCCSTTASWDPHVALWAAQGLLLVACGDTAWGVKVADARVAFRHACPSCTEPIVMPNEARALIQTPVQLDCIGPRGEVLWSYHVGQPFTPRPLPDGAVTLDGVLDGNTPVTLDGVTGAAR
jgi:hypothetical protein